MMAPVLHHDGLTLRMPCLADFEPRAAFYASDRAVWEGGPLDRAQAWRVWASDVGLWPLRGYGPFTVEADGAYLGEVGIYQAAEYPGPELGWFVVPEAEGKGVATRRGAGGDGLGAAELWLGSDHQHHRPRQCAVHRAGPAAGRADRPGGAGH